MSQKKNAFNLNRNKPAEFGWQLANGGRQRRHDEKHLWLLPFWNKEKEGSGSFRKKYKNEIIRFRVKYMTFNGPGHLKVICFFFFLNFRMGLL